METESQKEKQGAAIKKRTADVDELRHHCDKKSQGEKDLSEKVHINSLHAGNRGDRSSDQNKRNNKKVETRRKRDRKEEKEERERMDEEDSKKRRRVHEWQELKQKIEAAKKENFGRVNGRNWTLEADSDDEDFFGRSLEKNTNTDANINATIQAEEADRNEEIDPLDAFMNSVILPEVEKLNCLEKDGTRTEEQLGKGLNISKSKIISGEDLDSDSDSDSDELDSSKILSENRHNDAFQGTVKKTKAEKLLSVDHSKISYPFFRKNFYTEAKEISRLSLEEVSIYKKQHELVTHGKDVPKPLKTWQQTGLMSKIQDIIKKLNYEQPMPIQAQALPVIMSGRDCIGIAKTGSGKTLAFVLPMLRHIRDQPQVMPGDGPIALIMAPTRELVQQIHGEIKKFTKVMGVKCVPVYGGCGVAQQIGKLKAGAEIVICTPGRMIDMLCTNGGKIVNLHRVTYLVLDEADRMFDMGFETQITQIIENTRPDRQTLLFSATFPRQVEILARKVLDKPVEIQVGGRNVVNKDISQLVEVRPESEKFLRFLEILGEWYEKGKILTFVHSKEKCDSLFKDLINHGYPCLSFHGGKDQTDRESAISDFKSNVSNLLVATSAAARGLDVKDVELVVNYDVPNHYEDYVHRVGRTGRAGRKGCAITFISEEDARFAPELVKGLKLSEQAIPEDLKALADGFAAKLKEGLESTHGSGYGGSGFQFNEVEDAARRAAKKLLARDNGFEEDMSDSEDESQEFGKESSNVPLQAALAQLKGLSGASKINRASIYTPLLPPSTESASEVALAKYMNFQNRLAKFQAQVIPEQHKAVMVINDISQYARWKITQKETLDPIIEWTGTAITTKGEYFPPGKKPKPGESKLHLLIEGQTELSVQRAESELKKVLDAIIK